MADSCLVAFVYSTQCQSWRFVDVLKAQVSKLDLGRGGAVMRDVNLTLRNEQRNCLLKVHSSIRDQA